MADIKTRSGIMKKNVGIYAGSFDPPTNGHLWMINEGSMLFDELIVAIGVNPDKRSMFTADERRRMLTEITKGMPNVKIDVFENQYLVRYAKSVGADYILRGIRSTQDYGFEHTMQQINWRIDSDIRMVFLMPAKEVENISSSFVKGLVGPKGWTDVISEYVPKHVLNELIKRSAVA